LRIAYYAHFTPSSRELGKGLEKKHKINHEISSRELRVVDENGAMLGVLTKSEALKIAEQRELDLVEIAPQAVPPVCKIINYGKFLYELQKKEKNAKKHQQQQQMKELRFKPHIDTHDFNFKLRHARQFLIDGNKVKASIIFRGREMAHQEYGKQLLEKFVSSLEDVAKIDQPIKFEGKTMLVVMTPDKIKSGEKVKKKELVKNTITIPKSEPS
jgi:translation initiation factor IF-3